MTAAEPVPQVDRTAARAWLNGPSWVDRLIDRIEGLPGPAWLTYLIVFAVLLVIANAVGWLDGVLRPGSVDPFLSSLPLYPVGSLAAIHYLDRAAASGLERLRPALPVNDNEFRSLRDELTTLPARATLVATTVGLAFAVGYVVLGPDVSAQAGRAPLSLAFDVAIGLVGFPLVAIFFYHTIRQLWLVSHIQARILAVDLFHLEPLHALSGVTARTGIVILAVGYIAVLTDPRTFTNPTLIALVVLSILVAIAAFVLPVYGMHQRIAFEKDRLVARANGDLQAALAEVSRRARSADLSDADAVNKQLASLVIQRDVIARIPTWPWEPTTVRGFVTAILLPIALWLLFRLLDRVLG